MSFFESFLLGLPMSMPSAPLMALPLEGPAVLSGLASTSYAQAVVKLIESSSFKFPMGFPMDINGELGFIFT